MTDDEDEIEDAGQTLPRDSKRGDSKRGDASSSSSQFRARVLAGPDDGKSWPLTGASPPLLVGTGPLCEIRIEDPTASRRHASFEVLASRVRIADLGSTNGTSINGVSIVDALAKVGDVVKLGGTSIRIEAMRDRDGDSGPAPAALAHATRFFSLIGGSAAMQRLYPLCERLATSRVPLIIEGETGTGKEQLAEALHLGGPRASAPFVVFDCTAVAPSLVESELFGHEKGAFTGALATRKGVFEQADGGSLLLDEIGDLDLALQAKLLRAIERLKVRRVGGDKWIDVDVRILAATRRNLDTEVEAGRFRDDLLHRLAVARIELPPLRRRDGDVRLLAEEFARALGVVSLPEELYARWSRYTWPGNVRELKNAVARHVALGELAPGAERGAGTSASPSASAGDFIKTVVEEGLALPIARERVIAELERQYVEHVLEASGGKVTEAAATAGIALRHFQRIRARSAR